jgi:cytochrome P450
MGVMMTPMLTIGKRLQRRLDFGGSRAAGSAGLIHRIMAERRASAGDGGDLLSMPLHAGNADDGSRMSGRQVRDEVRASCQLS